MSNWSTTEKRRKQGLEHCVAIAAPSTFSEALSVCRVRIKTYPYLNSSCTDASLGCRAAQRAGGREPTLSTPSELAQASFASSPPTSITQLVLCLGFVPLGASPPCCSSGCCCLKSPFTCAALAARLAVLGKHRVALPVSCINIALTVSAS